MQVMTRRICSLGRRREVINANAIIIINWTERMYGRILLLLDQHWRVHFIRILTISWEQKDSSASGTVKSREKKML